MLSSLHRFVISAFPAILDTHARDSDLEQQVSQRKVERTIKPPSWKDASKQEVLDCVNCILKDISLKQDLAR